MLAPRSLLVVLACVTAMALGAPAVDAAPAKDGQGVVLSLAGQGVRVVDKSHRVHQVRVGSARGLRRGDVARIRAGKARVTGHARRVSFLARVMRASGRRVVVRLDDGSDLTLTGGVRPRALASGQTLLITLSTGRRGNVPIAIRVLRPTTGRRDGGPGASDKEECDEDCGEDWAEDDWADEVDGTVVALAADGSSLTIAPDDGTEDTSYPVDDPSLLDGVAVGDEVAVMLDEDGTAIDVELLDWAEDSGDEEGDE